MKGRQKKSETRLAILRWDFKLHLALRGLFAKKNLRKVDVNLETEFRVKLLIDVKAASESKPSKKAFEPFST